MHYNHTAQTRTTAYEELVLVEDDLHIVALARKKVPRHPLYTDRSTGRYRGSWRKKSVSNSGKARSDNTSSQPELISSCIATTVSIDMAREHKPVVPLSISEDGELYQGNPDVPHKPGGIRSCRCARTGRAFQRMYGAETWGSAESLNCLRAEQRALLCSLKQWKEDFRPFFEALKKRGVDIETMYWPEEKKSSRACVPRWLLPVGRCVPGTKDMHLSRDTQPLSSLLRGRPRANKSPPKAPTRLFRYGM